MDILSTYSQIEQFWITHPVIVGIFFLIISIFSSFILTGIKYVFSKLFLHSRVLWKKIIDIIYIGASSSYLLGIGDKKILLWVVILILFALQSITMLSGTGRGVAMNQLWTMIVAKTILLDDEFTKTEEAKIIRDNLKKDEFLNVKKVETKDYSGNFSSKEYILFISAILCFLWFAIIAFDDLSLEITYLFRRNLLLISPFLDLNTKDKFISSFISIKGKEDYLSLYNEMHDIANQHNIKLTKSRFQ